MLVSIKTHSAISVGMEVNLVIFRAVPKRCRINKRLFSITSADVANLYLVQKLNNPLIIFIQLWASGLVNRIFVGAVRQCYFWFVNFDPQWEQNLESSFWFSSPQTIHSIFSGSLDIKLSSEVTIPVGIAMML